MYLRLSENIGMKTNKNMANEEVAKLLRAIAAAYQVKEKSPQDHFKVIAYEKAADVIDQLAVEVRELWKKSGVEGVEGVGRAIARYLSELFETGNVKHFEEIFDGLPPAMFELLDVPGLGAKRALKLTKTLGITKAHGALEKLKEAAEKGRIRKIEGFGEQSEKDILGAIAEVRERTKRHLLPTALPLAEEVISWLKKNDKVEKADPLGSLRRKVPTVGDIDISVASRDPKEVIAHFTNFPNKVKVVEAGDITASILLPGGIQVDLMVQPPDAYGALLQHFTGSKQHNVDLRAFAQRKGLSLSEYGIKTNGEIEKFENEEEFYKRIGLDWIPPELREARGEIEASLENNLPQLVELKDIKGDLHMHSNFWLSTSHDPGRSSMEEMVAKAQELGYEYIAFSEHNPKSEESEVNVMEMLKKKQEKIEKINSQLSGKLKRVFNCLEIDIRSTGELALPQKAFDLIDFAIVSLHSSFRYPQPEQTKRVLSGLAHPKVQIFGHPTGRKLNERSGADLDWDEIFGFCKKNDKWLEINSWPERLDLPDGLVKEAVRRGIKLVIDTDSHAVDHMDGLRFGLSVARRGWATRDDIVNTLEYNDFKRVLKA